MFGRCVSIDVEYLVFFVVNLSILGSGILRHHGHRFVTRS